jgi:hypothetical protein
MTTPEGWSIDSNQYIVGRRSGVYHVRRPGRMYTLCCLLIRPAEIWNRPPAGKKACAKCAKVLTNAQSE